MGLHQSRRTRGEEKKKKRRRREDKVEEKASIDSVHPPRLVRTSHRQPIPALIPLSISYVQVNPLALQGNCSSPALGQAMPGPPPFYASGTSRRRKSKEAKSLARSIVRVLSMLYGVLEMCMHDEKAMAVMPMTTAATWQGQGLDGGRSSPTRRKEASEDNEEEQQRRKRVEKGRRSNERAKRREDQGTPLQEPEPRTQS
ncbi:hypothetical protein TEQG_00046 [Trichophyton equinum CBS 127.97]|uniref:Uncharacterized protein n=1 Tax=Trichophyton equinum (strain ATCC MYA-4606 / CBS 127.97) TaxID=559882 RepID=F2PGH3_TRIEC|nr:hypothetical protein TEQG_00046 [Trichophyton equinum CBS 127.97]